MLRNHFGHTVQKRSAFTLLEIAIALAIFVIGALAVVRIFPTALGVIRTSGDNQAALSLNRAVIARVTADPSTLPKAVYHLDDTGKWEDFDGAVLASSRSGHSLPVGTYPNALNNINESAFGKFSNVGGEGATVQANSAGGFFVLTQFPIFEATNVAVYEEADVSGVEVDTAGVLDFKNAYLTENKTGIGDPITPEKAPVSPYLYSGTNPTTYYVTYQYKPGTFANNIEDEPLIVSSATATPQLIRTASVVPGHVKVKMRRLVATVPFTTADFADSTRGLVNNVSGNLLGKAVPGPIAAGDKVELDYRADWSWILQEGVPTLVPANPSDAYSKTSGTSTPVAATATVRQLALTAPYIFDNGDITESAVMLVPNGGTTRLETSQMGEAGLKIGTGTTNQIVVPINSGDAQDELRNSRISFITDGANGAKARVAYINRDTWLQQLTVGAESYKPFPENTDPNNNLTIKEPWRDYRLVGNTLYFHVSEIGKSVLISYLVPNTSNGTQPAYKEQLYAIEGPIKVDPADAVAANFAPSGEMAKVTLLDDTGNVIPAADVLAISGVHGASVTVRTAYLNSNRYSQSFVTAMRSNIGAATS